MSLNVTRTAVLPAEPAANTIYLIPDGADGLRVVVTGNTGAVVKSTKTDAQISSMIAAASSSASADLTQAIADLQAYADQAEADARSYTDAREVVIRTDFAAADAAVASAAATDATTKANTAETNAKAYTDTRETAIRADFATADAATLASAKTYTDNSIATATTSINATTDSKIATAIGNLDLSNSAVYAATIAARDALTLTKNSFVMVADATGDATVAAGAALYFYNVDLASFTKVAEYESMDLTIPNLNILADLSDVGGQLYYKGAAIATVHNTANDW